MRFRVCSIRASLPAWLALAACSSGSPGETATSRDHALVGPSCTTTGRVICQPNTASSIAAGPMVTIAAGTGEAPVPTGGALVDGAYQLVAETQYGTPPSDEGTPTVGDSLSAVLSVHCDLFDEIFSSKGAAFAILGGNIYGYDQTLASASLYEVNGGHYADAVAIAIVLIALILILMCGVGLLQHQGSGLRLRFRTAA